ncbi:phage tail protein I [Metapseudomonas otitidis]|uniref:phage tail protein I n=1 Tax=Metapseudomonas otitidis TaxID=319939 RepID=UPI0008F28201|nr:phage tail protein I [Pseudomonas otitidis]SFA66563.1 phage tail protein, P2 protein I family [Pseudomonas otitidis]
MSRPLVPGNSTLLERRATQALAQIEAVPIPLRTLADPDACPVELLPYLAWAFSVDRWDANWPESVKRKVIRASWYVHAHKGTIGALRRVVEPLGYLIRVIEWWQLAPNGVPGTFALDIGVLDSGITDEMYQDLNRLIDDAKPVSRHLVGLAISLETRAEIHVGAAALLGDTLTVYPYDPGPIVVGSEAVRFAAAEHSIDTMSVYP